MGKKNIRKKDIIEALQTHFHDAKIKIKRNEDTGNFNGHILWKGFEDQSFLERQHSVFQVLRDAFGPEYKRAISMLFTYTPHEYEQLLEVA